MVCAKEKYRNYTSDLHHMQTNEGNGNHWLIMLSLLVLCAVPLNALAESLCFPTYSPSGVPGLSGAPDWLDDGVGTFRAELDDPRWSGAIRNSHPAASGSPEAIMRGTRDNNTLYLSFQVTVDADGPSNAPGKKDALFLAVYPKNTDNGEKAKLAVITYASAVDPLNDGTVVSAHNETVPHYLNEVFYEKVYNGGSWGTWAGTTPASGKFYGSMAAWFTKSGSGGPRAINLTIDLNTLGYTSANDVKLYYAFRTFHCEAAPCGATFDQFLKVGGTVPDDASLATLDTSVLLASAAPIVLGSDADCTGISLSPYGIGTREGGLSDISLVGNNTFYAEPIYDKDYSVGEVQAKFRIANWGSTVFDDSATWDSMNQDSLQNPSYPSDSRNTAVTGGGVSGGNIDYLCNQIPGDLRECPQPNCSPATDCLHQCILVELSKSGSSPSTLKFLRDSAWRNMNFVNASSFERTAEISIEGLPATSAGHRDVYIYIRTINMPPAGEKPIHLPSSNMALVFAKLPEARHHKPQHNSDKKSNDTVNKKPNQTSKIAQKAAMVSPVAEFGDGAQTEKTPQLHTLYEEITAYWPTYEVYVYHDTGKTVKIDGMETKVLEAQVPFGYHVNHTGQLYGWKHSIAGVGGAVLEEIAPNYFRVVIPDASSIKIKTTIESVEEAVEHPDDESCSQCEPNLEKCKEICKSMFNCYCSVPGAVGSTGWWWGLAIIVLLGLNAILRSRKQP